MAPRGKKPVRRKDKPVNSAEANAGATAKKDELAAIFAKWRHRLDRRFPDSAELIREDRER